MNLKEICLNLSREIQKLVPYDRAAINLPEGKNFINVYAEESRLPASVIPEGVSVTEGTATGWVLEHKKPATCGDVLQDSRFPLTHKRYQAVGIRSYVILPLMIKDEVLGALNLGSLTVDRFGKKEIDILSPIAEILSLAVKNSRLYEESQKREEMQKLLNELSQDITFLDIDSLLQKLTKKAREVLKADVSDVRLMVEGDWRSLGVSGTEPGRVQPASSGARRGLSRLVVQNRKALSIADMAAENSPHRGGTAARHGFRGYVGAPLFSRNGEVIGVLRALTYQPREFAQEEVDLLQQLASGAAIALENARLFEDVQKKSGELEDAFRTKTDFLNTMAHELRTPLNVVIGTHQILVDGSYGNLSDKQSKALERIGRYAQDLLGLINEILDLVRLDARKVPVHESEFSVREITDDLELSFVPLARDKGIDLKFDIGAGIPSLTSDRSKIKEILQNLLANALKYTEKGEIELRVSLQNSTGSPQSRRILWSVRDTGIGIGESDLSRLFEPFYMAEGVDRRKYPGTGLGLSIVKRLVELLDGDIKIDSELGKGSTFTVSFPMIQRDAEGE
jgi:signal transduction histidine kinase